MAAVVAVGVGVAAAAFFVREAPRLPLYFLVRFHPTYAFYKRRAEQVWSPSVNTGVVQQALECWERHTIKVDSSLR